MRNAADYRVLAFIAVIAALAKVFDAANLSVVLVSGSLIVSSRNFVRYLCPTSVLVLVVATCMGAFETNAYIGASTIRSEVAVTEESSFVPIKLHQVSIIESSHRAIDEAWSNITSYFSFYESRWVDSILRGKTFRLPAKTIEWFRVTGLYHLLVVSGFHFAILLGLIRETGFASFRLMNSILAWNTRKQYCLLLTINLSAGLIGFLLLLFLGSTPPAQRAFCCFITNIALNPQTSRFRIMHRIELSATLHAIFFPEGMLSSSGILSWLIYFCVVGNGARLRDVFFTQCQILLIIAATFGQLNLVGFVLNFLASVIGSVMMLTAVIPSIAICFQVDQIRYWNLLTIQAFLAGMAAISERVMENQEWLSYSLHSRWRWTLSVLWSLITLTKINGQRRQ